MTASSPRPAAPDTTGGELREAIERMLVGHMLQPRGSTWYREVAGAVLALPALRDLLAERDTLAAQVQAVEGLAEDYEGYVADRGRPAPGSFDHGLNMAQKAAALDLRHALGTPTTGGGE